MAWQVASALQAKGGGKKGRFQGKTSQMELRGAAEQVLRAAIS